MSEAQQKAFNKFIETINEMDISIEEKTKLVIAVRRLIYAI